MIDAPALAVLPSLPLEERKALPATAGIYFVLAGDAVLYIGKATNLYQRWDAHHRLKQLNKRGGCRIAWMTVDDAGLLDELEQVCITHFDPVLNGEVIPRGVRPGKEGETWIAVRVSEPMKGRLEDWAALNGTSVSFMVRRLIQEALNADRDKDGMP